MDGLRAAAVLSVIAFHVSIPGFSGGFVGVDVFFVISGYLITSTLVSDLSTSKFSLAKFYERRIRRIFPALFAMIIATAILAGIFLVPTELISFGKSLLYAVLSVSNIYFWLQSGYFEPESTTRPLLHTWSLGVEEQFYIIFPLVLALLYRRFFKKLRTVVLLIAVVSLLVNIISTAYAPASAFYLLPSRAWELMLGSLLSLGLFPVISGSVQRNVLAGTGVAFIVAANLFFTERTPFPGIAAMLPCLGAVLVIGAGKSGDSFVYRTLAWKPVAFIGQISYSLYLWHWPLIVFQRTNGLLSNGLSPNGARVAFLPILFVLGALSWRYVEQPFRKGNLQLARPALFRLAAVSAAAGLAVGLFFIGSGGIPHRFPAKALAVEKFLNYDTSGPFRTGDCFLSVPSDHFSRAVCLNENPKKENYLILGDSHAAHLWAGLSSAFPEVNFLQATASGCKPTVDTEGSDYCRELMQYILYDYLSKTRIDALVIAANWQPTDLQRLSSTIDLLQKRGIAIILFGPIFQYNAPLPRLLANAIREGRLERVPEHLVRPRESLDSEMLGMAKTKWHVRYISYFQIFCKQGECITYAAEDVPLLFDLSHLTKCGATLLARRLRDRGDLP